jgi:tRNA-Thr(GGU) m(6)t(6)A37 methyltransferase TsaA
MLGVEDLQLSEAFFGEGLGCKLARAFPNFVQFDLGDGSSSLALFEWDAAALDVGVPSEGSGLLAASDRIGDLDFTGVRMSDEHYEVRPIGYVESSLIDPASAPAQGDEGAPDAWVALLPEFRLAMRSLEVGERVVVLTWLDRGDRTVLELHPRDDPSRPLHGVFSTRSPNRPNPIGLHEVDIVAIDDTRLLVRDLEAVDGTPVVDIKPVLGAAGTR